VQTKSSNNISVKKTEGSFWESRNKYDIYVYYRPFGARYDRLVGVESFE
jgi:hypothetical protein